MIFVCDVMLGKLARYLRMLGLDAPYLRQGEGRPAPPMEGQGLFFTKSSVQTGRPGTVIVRSNDPREQLFEIKEYIAPHINRSATMNRCIECNVPLAEAKKLDIEPFVPEYVYHHHDEFRICPSCRRVYWEGSHTEEMDLRITEFLRES